MKKRWKPTILENAILIYDLETTDKNPYTCEPVEIGAMCADIRTLELKCDLDGKPLIFNTLVKPTNMDNLNPKAVEKHKITREMLEAEDVPTQEIAFGQFCKFVLQFARNESPWEAPYAAGYNICSFDNIIMDRLCTEYGYLDKKGEEPRLFHPVHNFDLITYIRNYFHNCDELPSYKLEDISDYFGISAEGAHRASKDVENSWLILKRFLKYYRVIAPNKIKQFKGCFGEPAQE